MRQLLLFFCSGIIAAHQLPTLPPPWLLPLILVAGLPVLRRPRLAWLWALLAGGALSIHAATTALDNRLPPADAGREISVAGRIHGIPALGERSARFEFRPLANHGVELLPARLNVGWYAPPASLEAGAIWHLRLRLRPVRGTLNPGGFERERQALLSRTGAYATVVLHPDNRRLASGRGLGYLRQHLSTLIRRHVPDANAAALAVALGVGDRQYIGADLRHRLQVTGTAHLVAISGLHIGLVSGGTWLLVSLLWRLAAYPAAYYPASLAAVFPALLTGALYAALAGFTLPTQRALVMVALAFLALQARRRTSPWALLLLALAGVLVLDPLAPLGAGLWLSFGAVASLLWIMGGRRRHTAPAALQLVWLQLALLVALAPLTLMWFGQIAWLAPLANSLAIVLVGSFAVPLLLLGLAVSAVSDGLGSALGNGLGGFLLSWSGWLLVLLDQFLGLMSSLSPEHTGRLPPPLALLLAAMLGAALLLLPRGLPGKTAALALLGLALLWQPPLPEQGQARARLMDAGHGHALLIRTRHHALLYDTGPGFMGRDLNRMLQGEGVRQLDRLVLSNRRAGSIGGAAGLAVASLETIGHGRARGCKDMLPWTWDQVHFRFLDGHDGIRGHCLLLVTAGDDRLLVAHALTPGSARALAAGAAADSVAALTWLVVPGHGHGEGMSAAFARALAPSAVLIPVNAGNRYGLPHQHVLAGWRQAGASIYQTGDHGQLTLFLGTGRLEALRESGGYWQRYR